jgi:hypothetical protein
MGHNQPTNLISTSEMSPRQEIVNKIYENGVILDGFHHLKLKKYIEIPYLYVVFSVCSHELFFKPSL